MVWIVIGLVFGMAAAIMTYILARNSGDGVVLTAKQRAYAMARLKRMSSSMSLVANVWDGQYDSSKTICIRWLHSIFHGPKKRKPAITPTTTSIDKKEDDEKALPERITWANHLVAPGVDFDN